MLSLASLALALSAAPLALSAPVDLSSRQAATGVVPLGPGPNDIFKAGGLCTTSWTPDSSGEPAWRTMDIALMTGANLNMTKLATVVAGIDGTDASKTKFDFECPEVDIHSAIYFMQYTSSTAVNAWTTRFTIATATGETVPPPEPNQPEGPSPAIPWGLGHLVAAPAGGAATASPSGAPPVPPSMSSETGTAAAPQQFSSAGAGTGTASGAVVNSALAGMYNTGSAGSRQQEAYTSAASPLTGAHKLAFGAAMLAVVVLL